MGLHTDTHMIHKDNSRNNKLEKIIETKEPLINSLLLPLKYYYL